MITSTSNPRVKFVRKLRSRRERDFTGLCYVEGLRPVAEAIQTDQIIERLVISPAVLTSSFGQSLVESQRARGIPVLEVSEEVFKKIAKYSRNFQSGQHSRVSLSGTPTSAPSQPGCRARQSRGRRSPSHGSTPS